MDFSSCNDKNPKVIQVEFDTGSLRKKDVWELCNKCNLKPEFKGHRIHIKQLENPKN